MTRQRLYSPKCIMCRQRTMALSAIPYSVTINHDGRMYTVEIPSLTVPKCSNCDNFVLDDEATKQIDNAAAKHLAQKMAEELIRQVR